jgi:hypothetical protein
MKNPLKGSLLTILKNPSIFAFFISLVALVGAIVLEAMNKKIPDQLWLISGGSAIGGLGASIPGKGE